MKLFKEDFIGERVKNLEELIRNKIVEATFAFKTSLSSVKSKEELKEIFRSITKQANQGSIPAEVEKYIAREEEIDINKIKIEIEFVEDRKAKRIFDAMKLFWSVPVSEGYGRRINMIIWDTGHNKVFGIAGLCDPVISLKVRDEFIGWSREERFERLYNVMTAYVLGAVPPYNRIKGSKMVALCVRSREVLEKFKSKYTGCKTIIAGKEKPAELVLIDTMGAFGKSSIYNRLRNWYFVGYSKGYTHHHLHEVFDLIQEYIKINPENGFKEFYRKNRFGNGANWKFRVLQEVARKLGIKEDVLHVGVMRGYYVTPLADNWREFLTMKTDRPHYNVVSLEEEFEYWKRRWLKVGVNS